MTVCIYSGRFQPFGPHHNAVYAHLCKKFGNKNVFIATSESESGLEFAQRREIMLRFGIPASQIALVKSPYQCAEIKEKFDPELDSVVFCVGEKDINRIRYTKKSGEPAYFLPFNEDSHLIPFGQNGYIYHAPNINVNGISSATEIRNQIPSMNKSQFERIFGWYDDSIFNTLKRTFQNTSQVIPESKIESRNASGRKHIWHPYEDVDLTGHDLIDMMQNVNATHLYEKFDGQNLYLKFINNQWYGARNKTEMKSPLTYQQMRDKFKGRGILEFVFSDPISYLNQLNLKFPKSLIPTIESGYFSVEILHSNCPNVIQYFPSIGRGFKIVFHDFIRFDANGCEIGRNKNIVSKCIEIMPQICTGPVQLMPKTTPNLSPYPCDINKTIANLAESEFQLVKSWILREGNLILNSLNQSSDIRQRTIVYCKQQFKLISQKIESANESQLAKYTSNLEIFTKLGGFNSINGIEGVVFSYNGKIYKLTGIFAPLNQILGIFRYAR